MSDERPGHDRGREPLIPEYDWQTGPLRQIVGESPRRLRAGTVPPIEIEGQPEDDAGDIRTRRRSRSAHRRRARRRRAEESSAAKQGGARRRRSQGRSSWLRDRRRSGAPWPGRLLARSSIAIGPGMAASGYHGAARKSINRRCRAGAEVRARRVRQALPFASKIRGDV